MDLTHSFTVPAAPDATWKLLTDLHRVGSCFPGATVTEADATEFSGTVKVKLGPISMLYAGSGRFVERDDTGHRAVIEAQGKDKRGNGTASATVTVRLAPAGDGTRAEVVTDLKVTGKPAQFGRGVMQDVSDKLLGQFVACIEQQLGGSTDRSAQPGGVAEVAALSASGTADAGTAPPAAADPTVEPEPQPFGAEVPPQPEDGQGDLAAWQPAAAVRRSRTTVDEDVIDLGSTVGPVLLRRYGRYLAVGLAGVVVGWMLGRGSR